MKSTKHRLFFALWPDREIVERLRELRSELRLQGRCVRPENWHITLLFVGEVDESVSHCLVQAASAISANSISIELNHLGYFAKPRIAWLGPDRVPEELEDLRARLVEAARACGLEPDAKPFRPHLTLARHAEPLGPQPVSGILWRATEFVLVESRLTDAGASYHIVQHFPLLASN